MVKHSRPRFKVMVAVLLILTFLSSGVLAMDPQPEPPIEVLIDNKLLQLDVSPVLEQGRTLVPLRAIFEALGADVVWNSATQSVTATKGTTTLSLQLGNITAQKNGVSITLQVPAKIIGGRTMVPLRFVGEALGAGVNWDGSTRKVFVNSTGGTTSSSNQSTTTQPEQKQDGNSNTTVDPSINPNQLNNLRIKEFITLPNGNRAITLANNKILPLMRFEDIKALEDKIPSAPTTPPFEVSKYLGSIKPKATVDLREWQTPIRDQMGRNTCVSFAVLAAMEARYKRLDPVKYTNLDLSEQYAHHIQKIADINPISGYEKYKESPVGAWGYGDITYSSLLFTKHYGVPSESALPYIPGYSYEDTYELTDIPRIPPDKSYAGGITTQKTVNDFNLTSDRIPLTALQQAGYRIEGFVGINDGDLNNIEHYKAILSAGHEIIIAMGLYSTDPTPNDNIWNPGTKLEGYHAVLLVGYDEQRKVFIAKNSWGYDNILESGYTLISFDYFNKDYVIDAIYITSVDKNPEKPAKPEQLFIGRWNMVHDGVRGILDIYRLPGIFEASALFNQTDRRIGTYFKEDGTIYRVNGSIQGNNIEFYIDFNSTYAQYGDQSGTKFTGNLFSWDNNYLAGSSKNPNFPSTYGFYATRGDYLSSVPRLESQTQSSYVGTWSMNIDGRKGKLEILTVDSSGVISGRYTGQDSKQHNVTGKVSSDNKRAFQMQIPFDPANPQKFNGYLHYQDLGMISGTTFWNNQPFGFIANRTSGIAVSLGTTPNTPSNLTATAKNATTVTLSWQDNSTDESIFIIERQSAGGIFTQIGQVNAGTTSFTDTTNQAVTTYSYRVKAKGNLLSSDYSNTATITTPSQIILPPIRIIR